MVIGNTDGIGLEATCHLLNDGWRVVGVSRSSSILDHERYEHFVIDIAEDRYADRLAAIVASTGGLDVCIHCAGIGSPFDSEDLTKETLTFRVNVMGAAVTTEIVLRDMLERGKGHFIGLSSIMDFVVNPAAPAYAASKAAVSAYWEGLAIALRGRGVLITNVRFGFVDTKMGKARGRPFLLSPSEAARFVRDLIGRDIVRATKPRRMALLLWLVALPRRLRHLLQ